MTKWVTDPDSGYELLGVEPATDAELRAFRAGIKAHCDTCGGITLPIHVNPEMASVWMQKLDAADASIRVHHEMQAEKRAHEQSQHEEALYNRGFR